jgi:ketosteroid isomerase-like protein
VSDAAGPEAAIGTVRAFFAAYRAQDVAAAQALMAEGFVFTSPQDDHIDAAAYLERCFPTAGRFTSQEWKRASTDGDDVFVMYEYVLASGERWRNAEVITVRNGQVAEAQVFFGGRY